MDRTDHINEGERARGAATRGEDSTRSNTAAGLQLTPGAIPVPADVATLRRLCRQFRRDLLDLTRHSGTGSSHIGGELSLVEILAVLFPHYGLTADAVCDAARATLAAKARP